MEPPLFYAPGFFSQILGGCIIVLHTFLALSGRKCVINMMKTKFVLALVAFFSVLFVVSCNKAAPSIRGHSFKGGAIQAHDASLMADLDQTTVQASSGEFKTTLKLLIPQETVSKTGSIVGEVLSPESTNAIISLKGGAQIMVNGGQWVYHPATLGYRDYFLSKVNVTYTSADGKKPVQFSDLDFYLWW